MSEFPWLAAVVVTATLVAWAATRLPEYLTALLFFAASTVLAVAPVGVVFAGFSSAAFWLVLSGFVLGAAIRKVGLADRLARSLAAPLTGSWPRLVAGVVVLCWGLAFVMPSNMGRIALLMPVVMALADRAGLPADGRGRVGLALTVGFATFQLSASILPANVPNLVMAGAAESGLGLRFTYLPYLLLHAPVLGLAKAVVLTVCVCLLFPDRTRPVGGDAPSPPWSAAEKRLAIVLAVTLGLWVSDGLHGVSPAWIGLSAACVCLLPRIGVLTGDEFATGTNIRTCLYIAGILGLANVVTQSGLGGVVGAVLVDMLALDGQGGLGDFAALAALVSGLNFLVTANGVPALFTPLAPALAQASGLPLASVVMVQVIGYATPLLPYQSSPIVVAMGMGRVSAGDGMRLCLAVAVVSAVLLLPADYLWFRALGWLGGPGGGDLPGRISGAAGWR